MATHDYNIANQTGANFRADLNNALSAILSNNASATEPTTTTAYMLWVDTTNNLLKMRNSADNAWITLPVSITTSNTVDIDGGTVNTITSLSFSSGETVTTILDEDDLFSDSASALATQQSIKAYVDSQVTAQDLDFQGDTGGALSIDLDSETFTIAGGNGIDTSGALNTLTIAIDSSVVTLTDTQTLTNKTIDADSNTISNLEVDNLKSGVLDTDLTSVSASDDTLASSKAIKTYVDAQVTAQDLDLTDGTTSISIDLDSEELSVLGGTGVTSTASGNGVTLAIGQDVGITADVTFNTVSANLTGDVTGTVSSIANHSTSDLSEGTNLYFTDERVDDRVSNLLVAGSNISINYDDTLNTLTISGTEDDLSNNTTDDLSEGSTNLYYTDERVDDRVATLIQDGTGISWSYVDASGTLTPTVSLSPFSTSDLSEGTNLYYTTARFDSAFSGKSTTDLAEGTNLYYTDGRFDTRLATKTTSDLTEGSNLYFTTARIDSHLSGGTGVTYSSGTISIGQAVGTSDNVTFGDVIVSGDLTVSGTTTTINTETIDLADNIIVFNSNATGTPSENAGIEIERGDATNKTLLWNETDDKWTVGSETFVAGTFEGTLTGNVTGQVSDISNHTTSDLTEGSNLYYTTARFDSAFSGKTTTDLTEGTNLYYTDARANSAIDARVTQSFVNALNVTAAGVQADSVALGTDTTGNYVASATGGTGVTVTGGTGEGSTPSIAIGQAVGTTDSVTFAGVTSDFTGDIEGAVKFTAKADVALTKGQAVYISGVSGTVPTVNLADADNASAMPAFGLVYANANANAEVEIITFGSLTGLNTSAFTVGKSIYISTTAGALTTTAPTGESSLIQNIGMVQRSHAADGIIKVGGAGRTNATPNLNSGKIFYGNGSNQSVATTLDTSIVPENTNLYYTDARANSAIDARVTKSFVDALGIAASTANTLATARDFSLTGDVTASGVSFDGSGNVALTTSIGSNTVGITELNVTDGTSGQVLTTDGAGTLSFADAAAGYSDSDVETYISGGTATPIFSNTEINGTIKLDGNYPTGSNNVALGDTALDSVVSGGSNTAIGQGSLTALTTGNYNVGVGRLTLSSVTTTSNNVAVGGVALQNNTGGSNTAVGDSALNANTSASNNTAVGASALLSNITGTANVAVGSLALENNTANSNVAIGYNAMNLNTSGTDNVAVGTGSLDANTTGNSNTAIGDSALGANTTASNNTAVGDSALKVNTTGYANIAIGFQAMDANTTGFDNIAIGENALGANTTSRKTVAIGESSFAAQTTGTNMDNVGVGRVTGQSNTSGTGLTFIGSQAGAANTTGTRNTALGALSLDANTTGNYNVAVGYSALTSNTASGNVAVGDNALSQNTTGSGNTALGGYDGSNLPPLFFNTTGSVNVAVGMGALKSNTTANNNTAVGALALAANTTGAQNTAMGRQAALNTATGNNNCAFGYQALATNTTGYENVAVGKSSMAANTTGANNVAVGSGALDDCTTGSNNAALGVNALTTLTTGSNNVSVGYGTGGNLEGGTENTILGASSAPSGFTTNSQIMIGYNVTGTANNRVHIGNASSHVYNDFNSNATWTHSSDERSKKDIAPSSLGLDFINELKPVTYKFKAPSEYPTEWQSYNADKTKPSDENTQHGMIAQDVKAALDKFGVEDFKGWDVLPDGKQQISEAMFVFPLIKAVQELSAQVEELKSKLGE